MSTPIITNPTPQARFQQLSTNITQHRALIEKPELDRAIDVALLEYQRQLVMVGPPENFNMAASAHIRMTGALEFIQVLRNLAETPRAFTAVTRGQLDHKA